MSKTSKLWTLLAVAATLVLAGASAPGATQTLEIILAADPGTGQLNGSGEIRGSEICSPAEFQKLKDMLERIPALADCFLEADSVRNILQAYNLTVREINTSISGEQHKLTWRASFTELPSNFGPLHDMKLVAGEGTDAEKYIFYARLGQSSREPRPAADPTLYGLAVTVRLQVEGTVTSAKNLQKINAATEMPTPAGVAFLPGKIEHSGEAVRWNTDAYTLQTASFDLAAGITTGSATEAHYWMLLMIGLTTLVVAVAVAILWRGLRKPREPQ